MFFSGIRPAVNVGLSVSRVGSSAQLPAMKQVAGRLRIDLSQYRELLSFSQFGAELDKSSRSRLQRGEKLVEVLKQNESDVLSVDKEVLIIFAAVNGFFDDIKKSEIIAFEKAILDQYDKQKEGFTLLRTGEKLDEEAQNEMILFINQIRREKGYGDFKRD
jgi:F-type H+-transporting ATPase subunit alpha